ncbi:hypothetical protein IPdc08_01046 [archaeon]|nr:hypothetical protein IPdc08_01046 [archaeon]
MNVESIRHLYSEAWNLDLNVCIENMPEDYGEEEILLTKKRKNKQEVMTSSFYNIYNVKFLRIYSIYFFKIMI